jgi:mono/diheme cytochrome c family protein
MKTLTSVVLTLGVLSIGGLLFIYSGSYNMGADAPHWPLTHKIISTLRDRSISTASADLQPPDLGDSTSILKGAGQYAAMCTGCHLAPGMKQSEIRPGLYPSPPNLAQVRINPKVAFWAIKHGIKMSAMPAWGISHDDATIWSIVAFLQKLPSLDTTQYKDIVAKAPADDDMNMGDSKDSGHTD